MAIDQPIKLCECGCGQPAPIATRTISESGYIRGQAKRFVHGHHSVRRGDVLARIHARCVRDGDCLIWQGTQNGYGYGTIRIRQHAQYVHIVVYEYVHGPIPAGLWIDHVWARGCHSRACCNEAHLEAVTPRVNIMRGRGASVANAAKTHCPEGHELSGDNLTRHGLNAGTRCCRICANANARKYRANASARRLGSCTETIHEL